MNERLIIEALIELYELHYARTATQDPHDNSRYRELQAHLQDLRELEGKEPGELFMGMVLDVMRQRD